MRSLADLFLEVLNHYPEAMHQDFAGHAIAKLLRVDCTKVLEGFIESHNYYKITGSAGQGRWARAPWIAIFNPLITESAQRGYYPVYLFCENFKGLYLSLNQGMTEKRESYKSDAKMALRAHAADLRSRLGKTSDNFDQTEIHLEPSSSSNDAAFYEAGNIVAKFYAKETFPTDDVLRADLLEILNLYDQLVYNDPVLSDPQNAEDDEPNGPYYEDLRQVRVHKRVERNLKLANEVKRIQGYICKICGFNFEEKYGELGKNYIEAHHLTPIADTKNQVLQRDPVKDFAVLCANCHRMVHRSEHFHDINAFRKKYLR